MPVSEPAVVLVTAPKMPKPDPESWLLIRALHELGVTAVIQVWDEPHDGSRVALVVSRTPWDYFDREQEFLAWAREVSALTRLEKPYEVMRWNHHKSNLRDLARAGVATVPTIVVGRGGVGVRRSASPASWRSGRAPPWVRRLPEAPGSKLALVEVIDWTVRLALAVAEA